MHTAGVSSRVAKKLEMHDTKVQEIKDRNDQVDSAKYELACKLVKRQATSQSHRLQRRLELQEPH